MASRATTKPVLQIATKTQGIAASSIGWRPVAVLENGQNADGSVAIPEALRPYMGGLDTLRA
jgi:seryl-tRNA synthetase